MITFLRRHPQVLAFGILLLANMIGLGLLLQNADADQHRQFDTNVSICQTAYDTRQSIIRFMDFQTTPLAYPDNASPEAVASTDRANLRRSELRKQTLDVFQDPECVTTLELRSDEHGRLVRR